METVTPGYSRAGSDGCGRVTRRVSPAWRDEAESCSRTGGVQKAMLSVEQEDGRQGVLVLWGSAMAWLQRIRRNQGDVWAGSECALSLLLKCYLTSAPLQCW